MKFTGYNDKNNIPINLEDKVRCPDGYIGEVVFAYAAYRVDVSPGYKRVFLKYNRSLLYGEHYQPNQLEVLNATMDTVRQFDDPIEAYTKDS